MRLVHVCLFLLVSYVSSKGLRDEFTWTRISYAWPNSQKCSKHGHRFDSDSVTFEGQTNSATAAIDYQFQNNMPVGANVWRDKLFITVPRRKLGIPSSLNYIPLNTATRHNVPLIPYPDWESNLYPNPSNPGNKIISVYRIGIDVCDRMWFVDTGKDELANLTQVQPAALVAIDLTSDKIILRHNFPPNVIKPNSGLASVEVDVTNEDCGDAFVYIPDLSGYGVIVYSLKADRSWRVEHDYFNIEPNGAEFFVGGHNFHWKDGVFSLELTKVKSDGYRDLYFHPMAGTRMYKVSTSIMRNESLATRTFHESDFKIVGDKGPKTQTSQADIDFKSDIMFLNLVNKNAVACWYTKSPLDTLSIVHRDDSKIIYPSDIKVANGKIYMLTNKMPQFVYGKIDYEEINFRVWVNSVHDAVADTMCRHRHK